MNNVMKIQNYIWGVFVAILLCGCFEDKGNYDYSEMPTVSVVEYITNEDELGSFYALTVGDVIKASPVLEYAGDSTALSLTFEWIVENGVTKEVKSLGFGRELEWKTDMGGFMTVYLFITDTITGYQLADRGFSMWPTDNDSMSESWMVLSEIDGKACLSILENMSNWEDGSYVYRFRELKDYYTSQNAGEELGGSPVKVMNHWLQSGSSSSPGMILILQNGGVGPVYVSNQDYKRTLDLKDDFINGVLPNVTFKDAVANSKCHVLLATNGDLYLKAVEHLDVWFAGKYIDIPVTIEGGMKIDRLVRMSYQDMGITGTFAIDGLHHRLLYIANDNSLEYTGNWGDANAISIVQTEPAEGITLAMENLKDVDILYAGSYVGSFQTEWGTSTSSDMFMFYKDNRSGSDTEGLYCIHTFRLGMDDETWELRAYPKIERAFPVGFQNRINSDSEYFVGPHGDLEFFFFSSGANNGELWGYIFGGTGGTDPMKLFDFGGKKIVKITSTDSGSGSSSNGMDLTVALETGEIYMFNVNNSHFATGITPKWQSTASFGKIVDLRYNGPAHNAI